MQIRFFVFALLSLLTACGSETKPNDPIGKNIMGFKSAEIKGDTTKVSIDLGEAIGGDLTIFDVGNRATEIAKAVKRGAPETSATKKIEMSFNVDTVDKLGNKGTEHMISLIYDVPTLKIAKYENLSGFDVLNLVEDFDSDRFGDVAVADYCLSKNAEFSKGFCTSFLAAKK